MRSRRYRSVVAVLFMSVLGMVIGMNLVCAIGVNPLSFYAQLVPASSNHEHHHHHDHGHHHDHPSPNSHSEDSKSSPADDCCDDEIAQFYSDFTPFESKSKIQLSPKFSLKHIVVRKSSEPLKSHGYDDVWPPPDPLVNTGYSKRVLIQSFQI